MENKLIYTAPEMTITELDSEDIVLISVDDGNPGIVPSVPWDGTNSTGDARW